MKWSWAWAVHVMQRTENRWPTTTTKWLLRDRSRRRKPVTRRSDEIGNFCGKKEMDSYSAGQAVESPVRTNSTGTAKHFASSDFELNEKYKNLHLYQSITQQLRKIVRRRQFPSMQQTTRLSPERHHPPRVTLLFRASLIQRSTAFSNT